MKLDKLIQDNPEIFSYGEPPEGHFARFEARMKRTRQSMAKEFRIYLLKIAALVVFIFLATALFIREVRLFQASGAEILSAAGETELEQAEKYYSGLMDDYYGRINQLEFLEDENEKKLLIRELREMDNNVEVMKEDLRKDPENEIIINAIISHYQIKLELMDEIITRIENTGISLL